MYWTTHMYCMDTLRKQEPLYCPQHSQHIWRPSGLLGSFFGGKATSYCCCPIAFVSCFYGAHSDLIACTLTLSLTRVLLQTNNERHANANCSLNLLSCKFVCLQSRSWRSSPESQIKTLSTAIIYTTRHAAHFNIWH